MRKLHMWLIGAALASFWNSTSAQFTITNVAIRQAAGGTTVTWTTSVPATGFVFYAVDDNSSGHPFEVQDAQTPQTSHSVLLPNLSGHTYYFIISMDDASFNNVRSREFSYIGGAVTSVEAGNQLPDRLELLQNYPNPFNPTTKFQIQNPKSQILRLAVYDILGHELAQLVSGMMEPGYHTVEWNAAGYPSGVYFVTLQAGSMTVTRKMILQK